MWRTDNSGAEVMDVIGVAGALLRAVPLVGHEHVDKFPEVGLCRGRRGRRGGGARVRGLVAVVVVLLIDHGEGKLGGVGGVPDSGRARMVAVELDSGHDGHAAKHTALVPVGHCCPRSNAGELCVSAE